MEPPAKCLESFRHAFQDAINPEWHLANGYYESVFYQDQLEHLARFNPDGHLVEHKMFLPEPLLPDRIRKQLIRRGEVMNALLVNKGSCIEYEVILRDQELQRFQLNFSQTGRLLTEEKL